MKIWRTGICDYPSLNSTLLVRLACRSLAILLLISSLGKDHVYDHKIGKDIDGDGKIEKSEMKVLEYYQPLRQHQGVIENNCRRFLKSVALDALENQSVRFNFFVVFFSFQMISTDLYSGRGVRL